MICREICVGAVACRESFEGESVLRWGHLAGDPLDFGESIYEDDSSVSLVSIIVFIFVNSMAIIL